MLVQSVESPANDEFTVTTNLIGAAVVGPVGRVAVHSEHDGCPELVDHRLPRRQVAHGELDEVDVLALVPVDS